jgi:hypothetical protein
VRDLLAGTGLPVVSLALDLTAEMQAELLALPNQDCTVLVAERINLIGMAHLIGQYRVPDMPLAHVASRATTSPRRRCSPRRKRRTR